MYEPDIGTFDGLCADETGGYFDNTDSPPWDTWVAWVHEDRTPEESERNKSYLVSWVREDFIARADEGINVAPTCVIRWLDNEDCVLRQMLRDRSII
jgi:hypothetical protein